MFQKKRVLKYIELLQQLLSQTSVSYTDMEKMVGRLVSLECAVPAGMWYTRHQYAAMSYSGIRSDSNKKTKASTMIFVTNKIREEWYLWSYFLQVNKGAPWKNLSNIFVEADVHSDASGRSFAGVVDIPGGSARIAAGEFDDQMLGQDIQVKEGEALRMTLSMIVQEMPQLVQGKTLVCKIDNQVLKAVLERKGTSQNLQLNEVGKIIFG